MNDNCNCHDMGPGISIEKPIHTIGRRFCICGWDLERVSSIITDIDWETNADGLVYELNYREDDLYQCTNPKCRLIKVI